MTRLVLIAGFLLVLLNAIGVMTVQVQTGLFIAGILLVGIPHGAADLLVGLQNAKENRRIHSRGLFLASYLGRIVLFGAFFYFLPTAGILIFLLMAAFHFGETDLHQFNTSSFSGKCFALSYGLLIIGFILLFHLHEAAPLLGALGATEVDLRLLAWLDSRKTLFLSLLLILFFSATFTHCLLHPQEAMGQDIFLWRLVALFGLLYSLPLLLGFFLYFVVWHSLSSLANIVGYLQKAAGTGLKRIAATILLYSLVTFGAMAVLSFFLRTVLSGQTLILVAFAALAVLTAPHMAVMHEMYGHLRKRFFYQSYRRSSGN